MKKYLFLLLIGMVLATMPAGRVLASDQGVLGGRGLGDLFEVETDEDVFGELTQKAEDVGAGLFNVGMYIAIACLFFTIVVAAVEYTGKQEHHVYGAKSKIGMTLLIGVLIFAEVALFGFCKVMAGRVGHEIANPDEAHYEHEWNRLVEGYLADPAASGLTGLSVSEARERAEGMASAVLFSQYGIRRTYDSQADAEKAAAESESNWWNQKYGIWKQKVEEYLSSAYTAAELAGEVPPSDVLLAQVEETADRYMAVHYPTWTRIR